MDPYYEQRLKEEVIYLHSLWHQGPPVTNPNPPIPIPNPNPNIPKYLQPVPTPFKKPRPKTPLKGTQSQQNNRPPASHRPPASDIEWPCPPPPEPKPETYSSWPVLNLPAKKPTKLASPEEQTRVFANRVQKKALKMAKEFFGSSGGSDDDESEDEDDAMEEDECEEYSLLMRIFMQDRGIRGYYEKNYEKGEFCCLVCGGIGEKIGKRFRDCVALVQHSVSIAKTKKRRAHRAYGQVICKVLGWDINRLPTIVASLAKPGDSQGNGDDGNKADFNIVRDNVGSLTVVNGGGGGMTLLNVDSNVGEVLREKAVDLPNGVDGELMVCENSQTAVNGSKTMEGLEQGVANTEEGNADGVVNHLGVPNTEEGKADGVVNHLQPLKDDAVGSSGNEVKDDQKDSVVIDGLKEGDEKQT